MPRPAEPMRVPNSGAGDKRREIRPSAPDRFRRVPGYEGYTSHTVTVGAAAAHQVLVSHRQWLAVKSSSSLYDGWHATPESSYGDLIDVRRTCGLDRHGADKLRRSKDAGRSSIGTDAESMQAMGSARESREARDVKKRKDSRIDSHAPTTARSSSSSSSLAQSLSHSSDSFRSTCSTKPSSNNRLPRASVQAAKEAGKIQKYVCEILKSAAQNPEIGECAPMASTGTREAAMARQARRESREARKRESAALTPSAPSNSRFIASRQVKGPNPLTSREEHAGRSGSRRIRKSWTGDSDVVTLDAELRDRASPHPESLHLTMMFGGLFVVGFNFLFPFVLLYILD
jgi:hypothetical protein